MAAPEDAIWILGITESTVDSAACCLQPKVAIATTNKIEKRSISCFILATSIEAAGSKISERLSLQSTPFYAPRYS
jgi:hypothetical protein